MFDENLNDVFTYADITLVEETHLRTVRLECQLRKTGARILVEGDDLDDAVEKALRELEDQSWLVENIEKEYHLTVDEIRSLVDAEPQPLQPVPAAAVSNPVLSAASAQPFLLDRGGKLYLAVIAGEVRPLDED